MIKNKLKKALTTLLLASPMLSPQLEAQQIPPREPSFVRPLVSLTADAQYNVRNFGVSYLPEHMRDIPIHENDWEFLTSPGIIPTETVYHPEWPTGELGIAVGLRFRVRPITLSAAPYLSYTFIHHEGYEQVNNPEDPEDSIRRRNYQGAPGTEKRGVGTALTYYRILNIEEGLEYGLKGRVAAEIGDIEFKNMPGKAAFYFEYQHQLNPKSIIIDTGWDRHNRLETMEQYEVARFVDQRRNFGLELLIFDYASLRFYAGHNTMVLSELLDGVEFESNPFTSFGVELELVARNYY